MTGTTMRAAAGDVFARQLARPLPALSSSPARLFLTSTTLLFAELLLIRWIPANVITGYQALLVVVAALYALAWLAATRVRLLADVELVGAREALA